jgi:hypothetical protein
MTLRICRENDCNGAVLSASTSISTLPVSHLKDDDIQRLWRATATPAWIIADVGTTLTIGVVALFNSNGRSTDTFQVRTSITDATVLSNLTYNSGVVASGIDPVFGSFIRFIEPAVSYRFLRIDQTQTDIPEAGRIMSGSVWIPSRNVSLVTPPESFTIDHSIQTYSRGMNLFVDLRPRQRGYRFVLRGITDAEKESEIDEINRLRGIGRDILVCFDKDSSNIGRDSIWGTLAEPIRATRMSDKQDLWIAEITILERL